MSDDHDRARDLWMLAIGAGLADPNSRKLIEGIAGVPGELAPLVEAISSRKKSRVWEEVERLWGLTQEDGELVSERIAVELCRIGRRRESEPLINRLWASSRLWNESEVRGIVKKLMEVLE